MTDCTDDRPSHGAASWDRRYAGGALPPWDLGAPPPALVRVLASLEGRRRVLVPGCGYGHDAIAWAAAGHEVVGVDFAPLALAGAQERAEAAGVAVTWLRADVLELPGDLAPFDAVWEQTCYCALELEDRDGYVEAMDRSLVAGGRLHGLFWNHGAPGGPPYDVTADDVRRRFEPRFEVVSLDAVAKSAPERSNEFLAELVSRRKP